MMNTLKICNSSCLFRINSKKLFHTYTASLGSRSNQKSQNDHKYTTSIFKNENFIPSAMTNNLLFEFKLRYYQTKDYELKMMYLKTLIDKLLNDFDKDFKFKVITEKLKPFIVDLLLNIDNSQFIQLFTTIIDSKIYIDDARVISRFDCILRSSISNNEKFKLISLNDVSEQGISVFHQECNMNKLETLYHPDVIKSIIINIYLPLKDTIKIRHFSHILSRQNSADYGKFKLFLDIISSNYTVNLNFNQHSTTSKILSSYNHFLKTLSLPMSFNYNHWNYIFIKNSLDDVNLKSLYQFIRFIYPNDKILDTSIFEGFEDKRFDEDFSHVFKLTSNIPQNIQFIFFRKFIASLHYNQIDLILKSGNEISPEFIFCLLEHASNNSDNSKLTNLVLLYLKDKTISVPVFENLQISNIYQYYKDNFTSFIENLEFDSYYNLKSDDISEISLKLNDIERETFLKAIFKGNFTIDHGDSTFVVSLLKKYPMLIKYLLSNGKMYPIDSYLNYNLKENFNLHKTLTFLKPNDLFEILIDKSLIDYPFVESVLKLFEVYQNETNFKILKINLLPMSKGKVDSQLSLLNVFLKENDINLTEISMGEKVKLYDLFIYKVMKMNPFTGLLVSCVLIENYRKIFRILSGIQDSNLQYKKEFDGLVIKHNDDIKIPKNLIKFYTMNYLNDKNVNWELSIKLFRNILGFSHTLKDVSQRRSFQEFMFDCFQKIYIHNKVSPLLYYKLFQLCDQFKITTKPRNQHDMSQYLDEFLHANEYRFSTEMPNIEAISFIARYESNLILSPKAVLEVFRGCEDCSTDEKFQMLIGLRNCLRFVPYTEEINTFLKEQIAGNNTEDIFKLMGVEIDQNFKISNLANFKKSKWYKFDSKYFQLLLVKCMHTLISKDEKILMRLILIDSISNSTNDMTNLNLLRIFDNVTLFDKTVNSKPNSGLNELVSEFNTTFSDFDFDSDLINPFVQHFLFTRMYSYEIKDIIQMIYLVTKGHSKLQDSGFFDILDGKPKQEHAISLSIIDIDNHDLINFFRLLFTNFKNQDTIGNPELLYFLKISDNFVNDSTIDSRDKYFVMNCTLIVITKHSDLLSLYYKKVLTNEYLKDYKISKNLLNELLYSLIRNSFMDMDSSLNSLIENLDISVLKQSINDVITKLVNENEVNLAQEFFLTITEKIPHFKLNHELNKKLSWNKSTLRPEISIDVNDGVNMKVNKFKIKLYDYELLDKSKGKRKQEE